MQPRRRSETTTGWAAGALFALGSAAAAAADNPLSVDRFVTHANGDLHVIRTSEWDDLNGDIVQVEQRLSPDGFGRLIYRYDEQSEATKRFHRNFCAAMDMVPSAGDGIPGGASVGWVCSSE